MMAAAVQPLARYYAQPYSHTLYVDVTSLGLETPNGTLASPFKSISAALAATVAGSQIYISPGTYPENIVMPDLDRISLIGQAAGATIVTNVGPSHTFDWTPSADDGAGVRRFRMVGITVKNTEPGFDAIHIDGSAVNAVDGATFLAELCDLEHVIARVVPGGGAPLLARCAGAISPNYCELYGGETHVTNVTNAIVRSSFADGITWRFDASEPIPSSGRGSYLFAQGSTVSPGHDVTLVGHPNYAADPTTLVNGSVYATDLTSFFAPGMDYAPRIAISGVTGSDDPGSGTLKMTLPDTAPGGSAEPVVDLSYSRWVGPDGFAVVGRPSGPTCVVACAHATFSRTSPDGIIADGEVVLDLRTARFAQSALAVVGAGAIDRDRHVIQDVSLPVGGVLIAISPPFPATVTDQYSVCVCQTQPAPVAVSAGVYSRSADAFKIATVGFAVSADLVVVRAG